MVLPTHRSVFGLPAYDRAKLHATLGLNFRLAPQPSLAATLAAVNAPPEIITIGCFDGAEFFTATLRETHAMAAAAPNHSEPWRHLDVAVLHALIIERALGITPDRVEQEAGVGYHRDPQEALARVTSGAAHCAFFLRATRPAQVCSVAHHGEVMPQKSTDFYPKALSGLVMYALDAR